MYCEKACNLIKELKRCEDGIPPYNSDLVNEVQQEIKWLIHQNNSDTVQSVNESRGNLSHNNPYHPTIASRHVAIKRNTRCLLAYHYNRLRSLRAMRWDFGSVLPQEVKSNLNMSEIEWFSKYSRNLAQYMRSIGEDGLNLTVHLKPPKSLYVEVRCLLDYGRYELTDGSVVLLKKDSRHFLPRAECEELIRQGIFQHIV